MSTFLRIKNWISHYLTEKADQKAFKRIYIYFLHFRSNFIFPTHFSIIWFETSKTSGLDYLTEVIEYKF